MINKVAAIFLLFAIPFTAYSQSTETKPAYARPDIPGTFTVELGLNRTLDGPDNFDLGLFGSRTINLYYQYEFRIMKSRMSFVPGIGLSLERYKFRNGAILSYPADNRDSVILLPVAEHQIRTLRKSQLITNYVDVPLELRYTSNPDDPNRSFKVSIGGRIGYMYDAFTKIKYKDDGEMKQLKDKQNFQLNRLRYGVSFKVGFGNFSLFGYYNLSPLFKEGKAFHNMGQPVDFNTFTTGISLSSF
jgi:hypothetical protein